MNINELKAKEIKYYSNNGGSYTYKGLTIIFMSNRYRLFTGRYEDYDNTSYKTLNELKKAIQSYFYN